MSIHSYLLPCCGSWLLLFHYIVCNISSTIVFWWIPEKCKSITCKLISPQILWRAWSIQDPYINSGCVKTRPIFQLQTILACVRPLGIFNYNTGIVISQLQQEDIISECKRISEQITVTIVHSKSHTTVIVNVLGTLMLLSSSNADKISYKVMCITCSI